MNDFLFPRTFAHAYPVITRAEGIRLWDADGNEYIDGSSGAISVGSIGYGRREVAEVMQRQAAGVAYVHDNEFHSEPSQRLARAVTAFAGDGFSRAVFFSGGSEAIESAIKLARSYHVLTGSPDRRIVIGRQRSFHGVTMFALGVGDVGARKAPYLDYLPLQTGRIPAPYCYRCPLGLRYPDCAVACAEELEREIIHHGPDNVAAVVAEPVGGAAAPALFAPEGYFETIRRICDRYGVLWIADEIVTGFGRTGRPFGYQHWQATPDILVVGKGLSGGYAPLSGLIIGERIVQPFEDQRATFVHGLTFQNHPVACAAGNAVLEIIEREHLVDNAAVQGSRLGAGLGTLFGQDTQVGEIRGVGLLWGLELVEDRSTGQPFAKSLRVAERIHQRGLLNGLVIRTSGDGSGAGDEVFISPPLTVTADEVDEILARFHRTIEEVLNELPDKA